VTATQENLREFWKRLCLDERFANAPYKIETNAQGQIIMSPTRNWHGFYTAEITKLLEKFLPHGKIIVECAVDTTGGTKEADVAWLSPGRFEIVKDQFSCSVAPEICVEVASTSNTFQELMGKKDLYLAAGALEYWLCDEKGLMQFFDPKGLLQRSTLCPDFPVKVET
jgi:Uma2 family endonuclease